MCACRNCIEWQTFRCLTSIWWSIDRCQRKKSTDQDNIKYCNLTCKTHQGQMFFFWKVDSWPVKSFPLDCDLEFYFLRRGICWLVALYISQAYILFCSSIYLFLNESWKKESISHYQVSYCGFRLLSHHSRFCKVDCWQVTWIVSLGIAGPNLIFLLRYSDWDFQKARV